MSKNNIIVVGGGTRSGKSSFALSIARRRGRRRLFLATAQPGDDEMAERIQRHRQARGGDFETIEEPIAVSDVIRRETSYDVVVLDCLTLWLANLLCQGRDEPTIQRRIDELTAVLERRSTEVVIVTNEVGMGIVPETAMGRAFRDVAGLAHQKLSRIADELYFAVLGAVLRIKPDFASIDPNDIHS